MYPSGKADLLRWNHPAGSHPAVLKQMGRTLKKFSLLSSIKLSQIGVGCSETMNLCLYPNQGKTRTMKAAAIATLLNPLTLVNSLNGFRRMT